VKKWISYILLCSLFVPFGIKLSILLDYTLDYNYYSTILCKNQDIPEMHCNGSCALMQKLKEMGLDKEQKPEIPAPLSIELPVFIVSEFNFTPSYSIFPVLVNNLFFYQFSIKSNILNTSTPPPLA
jgi:hypothetical protein